MGKVWELIFYCSITIYTGAFEVLFILFWTSCSGLSLQTWGDLFSTLGTEISIVRQTVSLWDLGKYSASTQLKVNYLILLLLINFCSKLSLTVAESLFFK